MYRVLLALLVVASVFFSSTSPARAALVLQDSPTFGADTLLHDTDTGLTWLRLTESLNISYNDMVLQLQTGGAYHGFRYATEAEIHTLFFTSAGISISGTHADRAPDVLALIELMGITWEVGEEGDSFYRRASNGINGVAVDGNGLGTGSLVVDMDGEDFSYVSTITNEGWTSGSHASTVIGHFLVMVPEPGSLLLLCGGGALLLARRRVN